MTKAARVGLAVALCCAVAIVAVSTLAAHGRAELAASHAAWSAGEARSAIVHARRAASCYVPGAEHIGRAHAHLRDMAHALEGRGDVATALFAWRASSTAAFGARSLLRPQELERREADTAIARLSEARRDRRSRRVATAAPDASARRPAAATFDGDGPPHRVWLLLLLASATAWLVASYRLVVLWSAGLGSADPAQLRLSAAVAGAALFSWTTALLMS